MIGEVLSKIRKDKKILKKDLAEKTNINMGHLTHIEKEERNPSHKTLKSMCDALNIPYDPIMHTYDKDLTEEQKKYDAPAHVKYDAIPVFEGINGYVKIPKMLYNASYAIKVEDNSMNPKIKEGEYVFIEMNAPLSNKSIGLFEINGQIMIRKFIIRKNDEAIRAEAENIEEIVVDKTSDYKVLGRVIGKADKNFQNFTTL